MKQQRSRLVWWFLFPLAVVCVTFASLARLHTRHGDDHGTKWAGAQESLPSCTFEQLEVAFGKSQADPAFSLPEKDEDQDKCWSLTDRILRVPKRAILNFDSLIPLGAGSKGGVFMVFINLDDSQAPCKAVYKTDLVNTNLCAEVWRHPFASRWSRTKSCLAAHLNPFGSSMPGELTGAVIFQAFQQYAADHPDNALDTRGVMPTWAMVPLHDENLLEDNDDYFALRGRRHGDYPGVLGTIMPYTKFQPLGPAVAQERTAADLAGLMHSAAQGLAWVHELGLTHQDLVASDYKNVGLVMSPDGQGLSHSILFDWGYTAVDDNSPDKNEETCTLGRACDFCIQSFFPSPRVGGDHGSPHSRRRTLDCENLRTMIHTLLDHVQDSTTNGQYWQSALQEQVDCRQSTQQLADFLAKAAKGREP